MTAIHYLPVSFGYEHYVLPPMRSELPVDKAVLLVPECDQRHRLVDGAKAQFQNEFEVNVERRTVPTDDFATVVATAYDDIQDNLDSGSNVYINTASSPWALGAGYANAAGYHIVDSMHDGDDSGQRLRERITLYHTEPETYHFEDLLAIARTASQMRTDFRELRSTAGNLRQDVETDKATVDSLVTMLDTQEGTTDTLDVVFEQLDQLTSDNDQSIEEGLREIVDGIESVTDGINTLMRPENQATLTAIKQFTGEGGFGSVIAGVEALGARPDSDDGEVTPAELFEYFGERLGRVNEVLNRVERRADIEDEFDRSPEELEQFLNETETRGVARGFQTFDGEPYVELPGPLDFDLRPYQWVILYTLARDGEADSIKRLTLRVAQHVLQAGHLFDDAVPAHSAVSAVKDGTATPDDPFVEEYIRPRIQASIQKNLADLEAAGFVDKSVGGRTTSVSLTLGGAVYTSARSFDEEWQRDVFAELYRKVSAAAEEFVDG